MVPEDAREFGLCACCGGVTRKVWGYLLREDVMLAAFFVVWTKGHVRKHGAFFDLIMGRWGDGTTAEDRMAVSLEMRVMEEGPQFMVVDAGEREVGKSDLGGGWEDCGGSGGVMWRRFCMGWIHVNNSLFGRIKFLLWRQ